MGDRPAISEQEWQDIQTVEAATWCPTGWTDPETGKEYLPYPSFEGKLERERSYQREMLRQFGDPNFYGLVIEIGSGPIPVLEQAQGEFVGIAVDPLWKEYIKWHTLPRVAVLACKAEELWIPSERASAVLSTNALDHFQDPWKALDEMLRVLRPEGQLLLQFCINNASVGHPHPAHKIDLTPELVNTYLNERTSLLHGEQTIYGWRGQPAWSAIYVRKA